MGLISRLQGTNNYNPTGDTSVLSLTEMVSALPVFINECVMELENKSNRDSLILLEAACDCNVKEEELETLNESIIDTAKKKIAEIFEAIKKAIKAVIDKIAQTINSFRLTGTQLVNKYWNKITVKDLSKFKFQGYPFISNIDSKYTYHKIDDFLATKGLPTPAELKIDAGELESGEEERVKELISKLKDLKTESTGLKVAYFNQCTGLTSDSTNDFSNDMFKQLRGDKSDVDDIKYTPTDAKNDLDKQEDLRAIQNSYTKLAEETAKLQKLCETTKSNLGKELNDIKDQGTKTVNNLTTTYTEEYASAVVTLLNVAMTIKAAQTKAAEDKIKQAKNCIVKAISYNDKKKDDNSYSDEEYEELDLEM